MKQQKQGEINAKLEREIEASELAFDQRIETMANESERFTLQMLEQQILEMQQEIALYDQ